MEEHGKRLNKNKNIKLLMILPIVIIEIYLIATVVLFRFGPINWKLENMFIFHAFILIYHISLIAGYLLRIYRIKNINDISKLYIENGIKSRYKPLKFINNTIYLSFVMTYLNCIRETGITSLSPLAYISEVINGITNPAFQYQKRLILISGNAFGGVILPKVNVLLSPLLFAVIPLGIYYFKDLKFNKKIVIIAIIVLECSRWIAIGTNKGLFDIAIIVATILLIKRVGNYPESRRVKRSKFTITKVMMVITLPIIFFTKAISDRVGTNIYFFNNIHFNSGINFDNILMRLVPDSMKMGLVSITSYLTQGYFGLSLAMNLPFTSTFGIGNSMFLLSNFKEAFGIDIFIHTYQMKLTSYGWDPLANWHTFYLWIANDVSFWGVGIVMFIIGYNYAVIWIDTIIYENPVAIVLMALYSIIFIYIPANNQVFSYPTTNIAFWGLTFYWLLTRKYKYSGRKCVKIRT